MEQGRTLRVLTQSPQLSGFFMTQTADIPAAPILDIATDKVAFIIVKAREFDAKEEDSDPDEGSNPTDDGNADVLEDKEDDPVQEELTAAIRALDEDERAELVALAWLGRGTYDLDEWAD